MRGMPCQVGDQRFQLVAVDVTAGEQQALPPCLWRVGSGSNDCSIHFWPTAAVRSGRIRFLAGIRRCPVSPRSQIRVIVEHSNRMAARVAELVQRQRDLTHAINLPRRPAGQASRREPSPATSQSGCWLGLAATGKRPPDPSSYGPSATGGARQTRGGSSSDGHRTRSVPVIGTPERHATHFRFLRDGASAWGRISGCSQRRPARPSTQIRSPGLPCARPPTLHLPSGMVREASAGYPAPVRKAGTGACHYRFARKDD